MRIFSLLFAALLSVTPALAGKKRPLDPQDRSLQRATTPWLNEPDGFLGLRFGVPLTRQLQECTKQSYWYEDEQKQFCYANLSVAELGYADLMKPPEIGVKYKAVVLLLNGDVEDICMRFNHADFDKMLQWMVARYGKPTSETSKSERQAVTYKWSGSKVTVELSEGGDTPDESIAIFVTARYATALTPRSAQ
jgi:hypothetical protein